MEEIAEKEKDYKQLIDVTQFLFERSQELSVRTEDQQNQLQMFIMEQTRLEETNTQNAQEMSIQK